MARQQTITAYANKTVAASATPEKLYATSKLVCSVVIQALPTNTDFIYVGDSSNQKFALAPGKSWEIHGDALDNGAQAYIDISLLYIRVAVNGEGVAFCTCDGY